MDEAGEIARSSEPARRPLALEMSETCKRITPGIGAALSGEEAGGAHPPEAAKRAFWTFQTLDRWWDDSAVVPHAEVVDRVNLEMHVIRRPLCVARVANEAHHFTDADSRLAASRADEQDERRERNQGGYDASVEDPRGVVKLDHCKYDDKP